MTSTKESGLVDHIWDALRSVEDPELRFDIVNLGLIYNVQLLPVPEKEEFQVKIEMTLTSPSCPMAPYIFRAIHEAVSVLPQVNSIDIQLVWEPPWSKDRVSDLGKMELGWL